MNLIREEITDGINLYIDATDKFKTVTINVYIQNHLGKDATKFALIPAVLKRGTASIKTYKEMSKYLENLYGATLSVSVYKKGERHIEQYRMEIAQKDYINEDIFEKSVNFLKDLIFNPLVENSGFNKQYVNQEKETQKNIINSRINDKAKYAVDRCFEEMCKGEAYSIFELGNAEDLNEIDEVNLFNYYKDCINTLPVDIYVIGKVQPEYTINLFKKYFNEKRGKIAEIPVTNIYKDVKDIKYVTDKMDVTQGKLTLGFRTNVEPGSDEYYSLLVYSGILGGGPFSKLFMNVREKASLAYYAYARLERFKGLMIIGSGIEVENYKKALDIINLQLREIEQGQISDFEFDSTIKALKTSMYAVKDNPTQLSDYYLSQKIAGTNVDIDEFISRVEKVNKDDVIGVSKKIKLDTVYFMTNKEVMVQ